MKLRIESRRLRAIRQRLNGIQIVNHRGDQRVLTGKVLHDRRRPMPHAVDERHTSALRNFLAKLLELAVEEDDVTEHQIRRVRIDQRCERLGLGQRVGDGLLQQDTLAGSQQLGCDTDMFCCRTSDNPRLGPGLVDCAIEVQPTAHVRQFRLQLVETRLPPRDDTDQFRLRKPVQRQRVQSSKAAETDDADFDGVKHNVAPEDGRPRPSCVRA